MTDIKIKRGIGKPDSLLEGELAIDTSTGMLYSLVGGVVTELNEQPEGVDLSTYVSTDPAIKAGSYFFEGPYQNLSWGLSGGKPYAVRIGQAMEGGTGLDYEPFSIEYKDVSSFRIRSSFFLCQGSSISARSQNGNLGSIDGFEEISAVDKFSLSGFADTYNDGWHVEAIDINEWSEAEWGDTEVEMGRVSGQTGFTNTTNRKLGTIIDGWGNISTSQKITAEDYLNADGNSIVYKHDPSHEHAPNIMLNSYMSDEGGIVAKLGGGADTVSLILSRGKFDPTEDPNIWLNKPDYLYMGPNKLGVPSDLGSYEEPNKRFVNAYFEGKVQAVDFLDAEGNSIVGSGGGGSIQEGDTVGQVTTWSGAEWTPDSNLTIKSNGYIITSSGRILRDISQSDAGLVISEEALYSAHSDGTIADHHMSLGDSNNRWKDAHFSGSGYFEGKVQATDFLDADGNSIVGAGGSSIPDEYRYQDYLIAGTIREDAPRRGYNHTVLGDDVAIDRENAVAVGWRASSYGDSTAVGVEAGASMYSVGLGNSAVAFNLNSIALGYRATTTADNQFVINPNITEVDFSNATIQATDFLNADGNPIMQTLTQAEYDGLTPNADTVYFIV